MRVPLDPEVDMHQQTVRYAVDLPEPEYWEDNLMLRDSLINMVDERFAPGPKGKWYAKSHFDDAPENALQYREGKNLMVGLEQMKQREQLHRT